jgi:hypothetical protein
MNNHARSSLYWLRADEPKRLAASVNGKMPMLQQRVVVMAIMIPSLCVIYYFVIQAVMHYLINSNLPGSINHFLHFAKLPAAYYYFLL